MLKIAVLKLSVSKQLKSGFVFGMYCPCNSGSFGVGRMQSYLNEVKRARAKQERVAKL